MEKNMFEMKVPSNTKKSTRDIVKNNLKEWNLDDDEGFLLRLKLDADEKL